MSHINNPSSSIDSNEAALLTSLEGLASGTGQAIVKSGSTTLGLVTFGDLTKAQADTYYYPLSTNPAGYLTAGSLPAQYWTRTGTTLTTTTPNDNIDLKTGVLKLNNTTLKATNGNTNLINLPKYQGSPSFTTVNAITFKVAFSSTLNGWGIYTYDTTGYANADIYKTTDGGNTWTFVTTVTEATAYGGGIGMPQTLSATSLYLTSVTSNGVRVVYTTDSGSTWTLSNYVVNGLGNGGVRISAGLWLANDYANDLAWSTDLGVTWTRATPNYHYVYGSPIDATSFICTQNSNQRLDSSKILKTTNLGGSYTTILTMSASIGYLGEIRAFDSLNYICQNTQRIYKTTDGGTTWTSNPWPSGLNLYTVISPNVMVGVSYLGNIYITNDAGATWQIAIGAYTCIGGYDIDTVFFKPSGNGTSKLVNAGSGVLYNDGTGQTSWVAYNNPWTIYNGTVELSDPAQKFGTDYIYTKDTGSGNYQAISIVSQSLLDYDGTTAFAWYGYDYFTAYPNYNSYPYFDNGTTFFNGISMQDGGSMGGPVGISYINQFVDANNHSHFVFSDSFNYIDPNTGTGLPFFEYISPGFGGLSFKLPEATFATDALHLIIGDDMTGGGSPRATWDGQSTLQVNQGNGRTYYAPTTLSFTLIAPITPGSVQLTCRTDGGAGGYDDGAGTLYSAYGNPIATIDYVTGVVTDTSGIQITLINYAGADTYALSVYGNARMIGTTYLTGTTYGIGSVNFQDVVGTCPTTTLSITGGNYFTYYYALKATNIDSDEVILGYHTSTEHYAVKASGTISLNNSGANYDVLDYGSLGSGVSGWKMGVLGIGTQITSNDGNDIILSMYSSGTKTWSLTNCGNIGMSGDFTLNNGDYYSSGHKVASRYFDLYDSTGSLYTVCPGSYKLIGPGPVTTMNWSGGTTPMFPAGIVDKNGSTGSAGQVLTADGFGGVYWN